MQPFRLWTLCKKMSLADARTPDMIDVAATCHVCWAAFIILPDVELQSRDLGKCQEHARCCTSASMSVQSFCLHPALSSGSASSGLSMSIDARTHISAPLLGRRAILCHCTSIMWFVTSLLASATRHDFNTQPSIEMSHHNQWASEVPIPLPDCILAGKYQRLTDKPEDCVRTCRDPCLIIDEQSNCWQNLALFYLHTNTAKHKATLHAAQQYWTCLCSSVNNPDLPQPCIVYIVIAWI